MNTSTVYDAETIFVKQKKKVFSVKLGVVDVVYDKLNSNKYIISSTW
jgi:hypothetical protein